MGLDPYDPLVVARRELDLLRKAQMIQNSSGVATLADRRQVSDKVMLILRETGLIEELQEVE